MKKVVMMTYECEPIMNTQEAPPKPTAPPLRERGRFDLVHDYEGEVQSCSHG